MGSFKQCIGRFFSHEVTQFVLATLLIASVSTSQLVAGVFKTGFVGKQMGKNHLAAFSMVNSFVMQTVMGLVFFVGSISSTVSRLKAAKKHLEIGQVINTAVLISVVWSIIVTPVLYLIMVRTYLAFDLYGLNDTVRNIAAPFYRASAPIVPGFCISIVLSGVLLGLKKVATNAVPTVIFAVLDVITVYIIVNVVKVDNLVPLAFGVVIMRYVTLAGFLAYIYIPARRRTKFNLISWNITWSAVKIIGSTSSLMIGRGLVLLVQNIASPVIASRLGVVPYDTYTVIFSMCFLTTMIGDAIGSALNIFGSRMLGKGEFKKYRKLSIFVPLAGAVVAALFSLTFWAGQEVVINSFSNDHEVLHSLRENWYMLIVLSAVTPFVGIFEGLAMSRHQFKVLFVSMAVAVLVAYLPLNIANLLVWKQVDMILISFLAMELVRIVFPIFSVYWNINRLAKHTTIPTQEYTPINNEDTLSGVNDIPITPDIALVDPLEEGRDDDYMSP